MIALVGVLTIMRAPLSIVALPLGVTATLRLLSRNPEGCHR
jgi:hypothetical protein